MQHPDRAARHISMTGLLLATGGAIFFSSKGILVKYAYMDGLTTETILLYRMVLSLPVFLFVAAKTARSQAIRALPKQDIAKILFCGLFGYYMASWLSFYSLHFISVQLERIVLFSYPALVVIGTAIIGRQWPSLRMTVAACLTYLGIVFVFAFEWATPTGEALTSGAIVFGTALVALSATFFATNVLVSKSLIQQYGSPFFTGVSMTISTIAIIVHTCILAFLQKDISLVLPPASSFDTILLIAIIGTVIPAFMLSEAVARIGPEHTAISGTVGPVATSLIAVSFLDEPFTVYHMLALCFCTTGILLISKKRRTP